MVDRILSGENMVVNRNYSSNSGIYQLRFQEDGNLVFYNNHQGEALWASDTVGEGKLCVMQEDGNLVIYKTNTRSIEDAIWQSNTDDNPGAFLMVQDDGKIVIYARDFKKGLWKRG